MKYFSFFLSIIKYVDSKLKSFVPPMIVRNHEMIMFFYKLFQMM
ncbi:hypothetical protein P689_122177 [Candidatus Riesia pediculischaeffi PTSU]|uniref:Uncharacterized protein n=1 Tax=Candidatus Riesia pediculischaeffi PTSU TaxID=1401651 RepID=A0A0C1V831_9ENTR|nr:hypothetical protein P689_122177 [Candidatus Riesia pediculischaeffi PTSU]